VAQIPGALFAVTVSSPSTRADVSAVLGIAAGVGVIVSVDATAPVLVF
jgi:hypothetical protein